MADSPASPGALGAADDVRLLLCTAPPGKAQRLARTLVEEGLVACANLVPGVRSLYRWKGEVADDPETLLLLKTRTARVEALARRLTELHPYEVPELISLAPETGLSTYLDWVRAETEPRDPDGGASSSGA
jgi:periplasmic divalent cation tolerance protein